MKIFLGILVVLGGLLALIAVIVAILLIFRFRLILMYKENELTLWIQFLFIKLKLYPNDKKVAQRKERERLRAERKAAREQRKKRKEKPQAIFPENKHSETKTEQPAKTRVPADQTKNKSKKPGLQKVIKQELKKATKDFKLNDYLSVIRIIVTEFVAKFRCEKLMLHASIGGDDAMEIATTYGTVNAAVYSILSVFEAVGNLNRCDVQITPDFTSEETMAEGRAEFSFRATNALKCILELVNNLDNIQLN